MYILIRWQRTQDPRDDGDSMVEMGHAPFWQSEAPRGDLSSCTGRYRAEVTHACITRLPVSMLLVCLTPPVWT